MVKDGNIPLPPVGVGIQLGKGEMRWGRGPEILSIPWSFLSGLSTVGIFTLEYSEERVREVNWLCLYLCSLTERKQVGVCVGFFPPPPPQTWGSFMLGVCVGSQ